MAMSAALCVCGIVCIEMHCAGELSTMLILPWPCVECGGNGVCWAKDNTAAFVLEENNTADDAAALCRRRRHRRPRSHVSLCQVTRPDKVACCKVHTIWRADLSLESLYAAPAVLIWLLFPLNLCFYRKLRQDLLND